MNDGEGFSSHRARTRPLTERKGMSQAKQSLTAPRLQCSLLAVPRSRAYAQRQAISTIDLALMRQLDECCLKWPFYSSRRLCVELHHQGYQVNRKRVQQLRHKMELRASDPKPRTSHPGKEHKISPY